MVTSVVLDISQVLLLLYKQKQVINKLPFNSILEYRPKALVIGKGREHTQKLYSPRILCYATKMQPH